MFFSGTREGTLFLSNALYMSYLKTRENSERKGQLHWRPGTAQDFKSLDGPQDLIDLTFRYTTTQRLAGECLPELYKTSQEFSICFKSRAKVGMGTRAPFPDDTLDFKWPAHPEHPEIGSGKFKVGHQQLRAGRRGLI